MERLGTNTKIYYLSSREWVRRAGDNYLKKEGDSVNAGETVVILEAMKMENALPAPTSGTIKAINFTSGDSVQKNDVLAVIG